MKSFFKAAAAFCGIASAAPLAPWVQMAPPPAGTQMYQLQATSEATEVNNQWVALRTGSTSYVLNAAQDSATKFWVNLYEETNTYAIHNSDDTRQVALQGPDGTLLYMVDVTNPNGEDIPGGQLMEWATFTMEDNTLGVNDGSTLENRTFVAVTGDDGGYGLALYDGASTVTETITPITLNFVEA